MRLILTIPLAFWPFELLKDTSFNMPYPRMGKFPPLQRHLSRLSGRSVKVLFACVLLWLVAFQYCRQLFWRDPHFAFFDDRQVYNLKYSLYREREAQHFITQHNSLREPAEPVKGSSNPLICASFVTVGRTSDDYFDPSIPP